jgi:hypothetical protein
MDRNASYGVRICVQGSNMDLRAVVDATALNHINSLKIIGTIEKLAAFADSMGRNRKTQISIQGSFRWGIASSKSEEQSKSKGILAIE